MKKPPDVRGSRRMPLGRASFLLIPTLDSELSYHYDWSEILKFRSSQWPMGNGVNLHAAYDAIFLVL